MTALQVKLEEEFAMSFTATLVFCSVMCGSNPYGESSSTRDASFPTDEQQVRAIMLSSTSDHEKATQIARIIKNDMTPEKVERLLGRSVIQKAPGDFYVVVGRFWMIRVQKGKPVYVASCYT
jgi:hypothetical protein